MKEAIAALKRGEPVIIPTETVYGLAAPVFNEKAIRKVFEIKGRPIDNPLIAHIASLEMAKQLSDDLGADFYKLAEAFWPGPLTLVVRRNPRVPAIVSAGLETVAIRFPSHPLALALIREMGEPLVAPSANLSGKPSPTLLSDALEDLLDKVPVFLDGGACEIGIESTVLSLFHKVPTLLRPGKLAKSELEAVLGKAIHDAPLNGPAFSPGMKYRHYAPKAKVTLIYEPKGDYLIPSAKTLYATLRSTDRLGKKEVIFYCDEMTQKDAGLMNRLLRASHQIG
jgi:L-threonylcarbamoyladenylate synthase